MKSDLLPWGQNLMQTEPNVPDRWQIKQMCFPAGARLKKRPPKAPLYDPIKAYGVIYTPVIPRIHHASSNILPAFNEAASLKGNLENEDYRFFIGSYNKNEMYSQCRVCLKLLFTKAARKAHGSEYGCCLLLTNTSKALLKTDTCVVCGEHCYAAKWGFHMCMPTKTMNINQPSCAILWMFFVAQPLYLRKAFLDSQKETDAKIHNLDL